VILQAAADGLKYATGQEFFFTAINTIREKAAACYGVFTPWYGSESGDDALALV